MSHAVEDERTPAGRDRVSGGARIRSGPADRLPTLDDRRVRSAVFCAIYLYQGLVAGFSLTALANHLAAQGVSAGEVALHFAVAGLPWTVQPVLFGPLVDRAPHRRMGRRRPLLVLAILGCHAALCGLLAVPAPEALGPLGLVFLAHSGCAALLDTACDRLILDHVPVAELGRTSAWTRGGFIVGTSLSAALFGWALDALGFRASVLLLLACGILVTLPPLLVREAPGDALVDLAPVVSPGATRPPVPLGRFLRRLALSLRRPQALRILLLCIGIDAALAWFELRFAVALVQGEGWGAADLSRWQAGLALASGTLGAALVGAWVDRAGPLRPVRGLLAASAVGFLAAAGLIAAGLAGAAGGAVLVLTNVVPGLVVVALVPALMGVTRGRSGAATQFEVYMAAMNLGSVAGGAAGGTLAAGLPLAVVALAAAAALAGCAALAGAALRAPGGGR
ncbi:MFS transporter [Methylobacterium sp. A54F]